MADYRPNNPFNVCATLLVPSMVIIKGVRKKVYTPDTEPIYCSFKTFGGTEKVINDLLVVEDTAIIETWYDPRITSECELEIDGVQFEILGTPENINMRNQFMKLKVRAIKGGA